MPRTKKCQEFKKTLFLKILRIFKVIRAIEGGIVQTFESAQILCIEEQIPYM